MYVCDQHRTSYIFLIPAFGSLWHLRCKYDFVMIGSFSERTNHNQSFHLSVHWAAFQTLVVMFAQASVCQKLNIASLFQ